MCNVICVDPIGGCAPGDECVQTVHRLTFDPREEPGALAAHAGTGTMLSAISAASTSQSALVEEVMVKVVFLLGFGAEIDVKSVQK